MIPVAVQSELISAQVCFTNNLDDGKAPVVQRYVERTLNQIRIFCNREDIPAQLELVAEQIAEDMLKVDGVIEVPEEVSSIQRGDATIHLRDKGVALKNVAAFVKDYDAQLVHFKKMRLPG